MSILVPIRRWAQPQQWTPLRDGLRASEVWTGSQYARTMLQGVSTVLSSASIVQTESGIAASMTAAGTSSVQLAANRQTILPNGANFTIALLRRSRDTTARASTLFGYNNTGSDRVLAHAPYNDGNLYWDGGNNTAGSGRVSVAFTKSTAWETLVFYAGSRGREVWRNGVRIASSTSATVSLSGSATPAFYLGATASNNSDSDDIALAVVAGGYDWSPDECATWGRDPWGQTFEPRRILVGAASAGGDVTVALTGQSATASAGTLLPSAAVAASGQAVTVSAGSLTPDLALALVGSAVTVSAGTIIPALAIPLSGIAVTASAGTLTPSGAGDVSVALTGSAVSALAGTLAPETSVAFLGQALSALAGSLVPGLSVTITGSSSAVSAGTLSVVHTNALTGAEVTVAAGTLTPVGGTASATVTIRAGSWIRYQKIQ